MPRLTTRDYKRPSRGAGASKLKEFGLGVLVGAVLASAAFLVAGARARQHAAASAQVPAAASHGEAAPEQRAGSGSSDGSNASDGASAGSSSDAARSARAAPAPQYDFYQMLPRLNVPVPHDSGAPAHSAPAANPPARAGGAGPSYLLQVGSYRSGAQADEVRARLARAGISAQVQRVAQGGRTWNRVRIGPLSDAQLARVRQQLRTANIHALIIRADR